MEVTRAILQQYPSLTVAEVQNILNIAGIDSQLSQASDCQHFRAAYKEFMEKTDFIQVAIQNGSLPIRYLGWHRADIIKDLIGELPREVLAWRELDSSGVPICDWIDGDTNYPPSSEDHTIQRAYK